MGWVWQVDNAREFNVAERDKEKGNGEVRKD
jgi:hypothetical protein